MISISVILPVILPTEAHEHITRCCIEVMRCTTRAEFELVIVETETDRLEELADVYVHRPARTSYVRDFNAGIEASHGDLVVHTGNDIMMGQGWLEAMVEVFDRFDDAGAASPAVIEPGAFIGPPLPERSIVESFFGALCMFPRQYRLDEATYQDTMSDHDLCMQIYADGRRAYRNNAAVCRHLKDVSFDASQSRETKMRRFHEGVAAFDRKWARSPWLIKHMIIRGGVQYGKEHEWASR